MSPGEDIMTTDDTYNGWTNRETWAVALWINNEQGWQDGVHDALREALSMQTDELTASKAGEIVRESVEQLLTVDGYIEMTGEDHLPAELSRIAEDIGSLYRVDWREIGASFLRDVQEQ
jgi:hypothetical protein